MKKSKPVLGAAGCDQLYRIIAPHVPPSPGQTHTAGTPPPSVGGRRRSIIIPMWHPRVSACHGRIYGSRLSLGNAIIAPHHKPLHRMVSYLLHPMFSCQGTRDSHVLFCFSRQQIDNAGHDVSILARKLCADSE